MFSDPFTAIHTLLSFLALLAGIPAIAVLRTGRPGEGWTAVFLASAILTSTTGFGFPIAELRPSHIVGAARSWCWRPRSMHATSRG